MTQPIGRRMRFSPYISSKKHSHIHCSAIRETCAYYIEQKGDIGNLVRMLNRHKASGNPDITERDLIHPSHEYFAAEFYFYLVMFAKHLIGRDDFHFGEHSEALLSEHHRIYERGPVHGQPWYTTPDTFTAKGFALLNIRIPLLFLKQAGENTDELLSWFFEFIPNEAKVDESFFENETFHVSSETCLLFHALVEAFCNGSETVRNAFYQYYIFGDRLFFTQFRNEPKSTTMERIKEMRKRTISTFDENLRFENRTILWDIYLKADEGSADLGTFQKGGLKIGYESNLGASLALLEHAFHAKVRLVSSDIIWEYPDKFGCAYRFRICSRVFPRLAFFSCCALIGASLCHFIFSVAQTPENGLAYGAVLLISALLTFAIAENEKYRAVRRMLAKFVSVSTRQARLLNTEQKIQQDPSDKTSTALTLSDYPLSQREREICSMIIQGASNKEIAARLRISSRTVENRIYFVFKKVGVHSRAEFMSRIIANSNTYGMEQQSKTSGSKVIDRPPISEEQLIDQ